MTPGSTTWAEAVPTVIVAAALLFVPGTVAARLVGARLLTALAVAPAVSTTMLVVGGVAAGSRMPWGLLPLGLVTVGTWGLAAVAGLAIRSQRRGSPDLEDEPQGLDRWLLRLATAGGLLFTVVTVAAVLVQVSVTPDHFPQHPDTIFHLGDARWMAERRDVSVLHAYGFLSERGTGFYPAAFHVVTATTTLLSGSNVVVATSACVLVMASLVWPLGLMLLARALFGARPEVVGTAAVASVLFTAFPFSIMGFGVLWPNLFGQTLLPSTIALSLAAIARFAPHRSPVLAPAPAALLALASLPGMSLAHPNALITFLVAGYLVVGIATLRRAWELRGRPLPAIALVLGLAAVTAAAAVAATAIRPASMVATGAKGPELGERAALLETLLFAPRHGKPLVLAAGVVAIGAIVLLVRHRGAGWVTAALALFMGLFFLNVAVDSPEARYLTWPWYNNAVRLAAAGALPAALCATAGLLAIGAVLARPLRRMRWAALGASTAVMAVFLVLTHGYVFEHRNFVRIYFNPSQSHSWATDTELVALRQLATHIPPDAVTAANAWNGGTYLYVVSGRRLLVPTEKGLADGDRKLLATRLDQAGTSPEVCAAARRQDVEYALTGGEPFDWAGSRVTQYRGIDRVGSSPAFELVDSAGPYRLYRMVACAAA